ncbi:hypothetical protein ACFWZU_15440 [Frateuria sp. GZRR33]|uniref:hypothetical protein n=1 Tax=Frateuria sp. GZRR33 TaxID=3351535 RepID=UPI003EDBD74A
MADLPEITCCYCGKAGSRSQIHKGGWILAKSRIGGYACTDCAPIDNAKDKRKDPTHDA